MEEPHDSTKWGLERGDAASSWLPGDSSHDALLLALLYRKGVSEKKRKLGSFYFLAKSSQVYLAIQSKPWVTKQEGEKKTSQIW